MEHSKKFSNAEEIVYLKIESSLRYVSKLLPAVARRISFFMVLHRQITEKPLWGYFWDLLQIILPQSSSPWVLSSNRSVIWLKRFNRLGLNSRPKATSRHYSLLVSPKVASSERRSSALPDQASYEAFQVFSTWRAWSSFLWKHHNLTKTTQQQLRLQLIGFRLYCWRT